MKERVIIFPFDDADGVGEKVFRIQRMIGYDNVQTDMLDGKVPGIVIRCTKKQWKEIRFICDLEKCYW